MKMKKKYKKSNFIHYISRREYYALKFREL